MKLDEIISRDGYSPVSTEEMIFVLKQYVKDRKGKDVEIYIPHHPDIPMLAMDQLKKLTHNFIHAKSYYKQLNR